MHTVVGGAVERSYARSDLFDQRRGLMDRWAAFVTAPRLPGDTPAPVAANESYRWSPSVGGAVQPYGAENPSRRQGVTASPTLRTPRDWS